MSNLRRLLGGAKTGSRTILADAKPGYRLSAADDDWASAGSSSRRTLGYGLAAAGPFEKAGCHLPAALAEWRGPVLEDLRDPQFVDMFATALAEDKVVCRMPTPKSKSLADVGIPSSASLKRWPPSTPIVIPTRLPPAEAHACRGSRPQPGTRAACTARGRAETTV